jgi:surface antigen
MLTRGSSLTALATLLVVLSGPTTAGAKPKVAPRIAAEVATNGGGNRLDVLVRVTTGRPSRRCSGTAVMHGVPPSRLKTLVTGAKGGRQWHWYLGDGAPRRQMTVTIRCHFPDSKTFRRVVRVKVGPGPYPRRPFRHLVQPGSLSVEKWSPAGRYDGSGGGADLYPKGQCTWYVARQRPDLPYFLGSAGNAKNWIASARSHNLPTGIEPAVGAVAVFQPGQYGAGYFGHVAYVESVNGDKITISEANFGSRQPGTRRTLPWSGLRFIYREIPPLHRDPVVPPPTTSPPTSPLVPASKQPPIWPTLDLLSQFGMRMNSADEGDLTGGGVAPAGDVNGDGIPDIAVSASLADNHGREDSGSVYVMFGSRGLGGTMSLGQLGASGYRIDGGASTGGAASGSWTGSSIADAGDLNGDGRHDLVIGAPGMDANGREDSGSAFVVFGKADNAPVDLDALGGQGFRIDGAAAGDFTGSVAGAGDVNGDGKPDLIIGARWAGGGGSLRGTAYVVFGGSTQSLDLAALGSRGFRIDGAQDGDDLGGSVAGIGDMDGDGLADILVGAPDADRAGAVAAGVAYVIHGRRDTSPVFIDSTDFLGEDGFAIKAAAAQDQLGTAVAPAGDINGDGMPDVLVSASYASYNTRGSSGSVYVIFGRRDLSTVDLTRLGAGGFRIDGASPGDNFGSGVAGAGDVNADGVPDIIVGAWQVDFAGRNASGAAYVVFGKANNNDVDTAHLGAGGFILGGPAEYDWAADVAGVGDVNGDGKPDLLVGASHGVRDFHTDQPIGSGTALLVFGRDPPS